MKVLVLLSSFLVLASSTAVDFFHSKCYNSQPLGQIVSLDVVPCDGQPCHFPEGHNISMSVTFTSPTEITAAKPVVYAHLGILTVPEPFHMEQDACRHFNTPCPLSADTQHTYTASVFIKPSTPQIRLVAEWQIHDQNDDAIICFFCACSSGELK